MACLILCLIPRYAAPPLPRSVLLMPDTGLCRAQGPAKRGPAGIQLYVDCVSRVVGYFTVDTGALSFYGLFHRGFQTREVLRSDGARAVLFAALFGVRF